MAAVNVVNVGVINNPAPFTQGFAFEITFECNEPLPGDLEWKVVYVGSASSAEYDQELENVLVGPVSVGRSKFVLETNAPDSSRIPDEDLLGATVVLVTCSYRGREFTRVGYWVVSQYSEPLPEGTEIPRPIDVSKVTRQVIADKPRVTKFPIEWR